MDPQTTGNHLQTPADLLVGRQGRGDSPGSSTWEIFHKILAKYHTVAMVILGKMMIFISLNLVLMTSLSYQA